MKNINKDNVILYHKKIIKATGGTSEIRDMNLIESALNRGAITFDGQDLYKTDIQKISAITHSLIKNHAFVDGNKRIDIAVMLLLLKINFIQIDYTQRELIDLGLNVAEGKSAIEEITSWINDHKV